MSKIENVRVELKNIASVPNLLAEILGVVNVGELGKVEVCLATLNKSENFDKNPDGFWMPCTSMTTKKGARYSKVRFNGVAVNQFTDEFKAQLIEMVKLKKTSSAKEQVVAHDWCK